MYSILFSLQPTYTVECAFILVYGPHVSPFPLAFKTTACLLPITVTYLILFGKDGILDPFPTCLSL